MDFLPVYVLLGVAIGFVVILVFENLRVALAYLVMLGRIAIALSLFMLLGGLLGWWELPRPLAALVRGLSRLWEPFQMNLREWIQSQLG